MKQLWHDYMNYFDILDDIQEDGQINMFEAPRVLRDMFDLDKQESFAVVQEWMKSKEKKVFSKGLLYVFNHSIQFPFTVGEGHMHTAGV